jgi:hypothetical protein
VRAAKEEVLDFVPDQPPTFGATGPFEKRNSRGFGMQDTVFPVQPGRLDGGLQARTPVDQLPDNLEQG